MYGVQITIDYKLKTFPYFVKYVDTYFIVPTSIHPKNERNPPDENGVSILQFIMHQRKMNILQFIVQQ